jgi:hypothetical protein
MTIGVRCGWTADHSKKLHHHTTEMEQMMAHLLAEMKTIKPKMDANLKKMRGEREPAKNT